ncbi:MAG: right-handed parallel beta-helix repeat-containing protein [Candidatus Paceibacterota bacterium]|jgi:hypothetical protein
MKFTTKYFWSGLFIFLLCVFANQIFAQTDIYGGIISQDTIWNKDGSPYVIYAPVEGDSAFIVGAGSTLTIEAGSVVKFDYSQLMNVQGKLVVNGTADEKVYFTSLYDDSIGGDVDGDEGLIEPYNTDWMGIQISGGGSIEINNTVISYAESALTLDSSFGEINNLTISNCRDGINAIFGSDVSIENLSIENILGDAIFLYQNSTSTIKNTIINNVGGDLLGVYYGSSLKLENSDIKNVIGQVLYMFTDSFTEINNSGIENSNDGITYYNNSVLNIIDSSINGVVGSPFIEFYHGSNLNFINSSLQNISGTVIGCYGADWSGYSTTTLIISSSTISGGDGIGLQISGNMMEANISKSIIKNFIGDGIQTYSFPSINISGSELSGNNVGITSWGSNIEIKNSIVADNITYGISNNPIQSGAPEIKAINNWWGDKSGPFNADINASGTANGVTWNIAIQPWLNSKPGEKPKCCSNVMFLPGLEASRLYYIDEDGKEKRIWEPELIHNNSLLYLDENGNSKTPGVYTKDVIDNAYVPLKGNIYTSFISSMNGIKNDGLIKDWSAVPYDWRMSVEDLLESGFKNQNGEIYYDKNQSTSADPYILSELYRLASSSDTGKVTIIAHSNGGLVTKILTNKLGDEASKLIDQIIFVAVPQVGTPQAIGSLLHGFDEGLPVKFAPIFFSATEARKLGINMSSAYGLIPSSQYFDYISGPVITFDDSDLLKNWREKYGSVINSGTGLYDFISDQTREILATKSDLVSLPILNKKLYDSEKNIHDIKLDNLVLPENIQLTEIAGWGAETLSGIEYYQGISITCENPNVYSTCSENSKTPVLEYNPILTFDGDGTVVVPSALWTVSSTNVKKYWVDLERYGNSYFNMTLNRKHADILEISELNNFIQNLIVQSTNPLPKYISTSTPINSELGPRLQFTLHSPLSLDMYDEQGNHTGFSTTTNEIEENIPGSNYLTFGEVKYISVPASSTMYLSMNGYSSGSFTLNIEEVQGSLVTASTTFAGIPSSTSTIATISIPDGNIASTSQLYVDIDGDGSTEINLLPKLGEIVTPILVSNKKGEESNTGISYSYGGGWLSPISNYIKSTTTITSLVENKDNEIQPTSTLRKNIEKKGILKKAATNKISKIKPLNNHESQTASIGSVSLSDKFFSFVYNIFIYFKTVINKLLL